MDKTSFRLSLPLPLPLPLPLAAALAMVLAFNGIAQAKPLFTELQYNPHWYRTYDSTSDILPKGGELLFNWIFADAQSQPDSFFVGIDTLWGLPQDVGNDTAADWDLQVCPNEICMNGLKAGIHGANAPEPFETGKFTAEHHFQFFPALDAKTFNFISPPRRIFGGLMFCRSRSTGMADTVLGFGSWGLAWDSTRLPPERPVDGYLPKLSDFVISGDTVRYLKGATGIAAPRNGRARSQVGESRLSAFVRPEGLHILFPGLPFKKSIRIFGLDGTLLGESEKLSEEASEWIFPRASIKAGPGAPTCILVKLSWHNGEDWKAIPLLLP
jgi:hypothetical protein